MSASDFLTNLGTGDNLDATSAVLTEVLTFGSPDYSVKMVNVNVETVQNDGPSLFQSIVGLPASFRYIVASFWSTVDFSDPSVEFAALNSGSTDLPGGTTWFLTINNPNEITFTCCGSDGVTPIGSVVWSIPATVNTANHFIVSCDLVGQVYQCYVNGVACTILDSSNTASGDMTNTVFADVVIQVAGSINAAIVPTNFPITEFWLSDTDLFFDLSNSVNLAKFYGGANTPANLGPVGGTPTGSPPVLYFTDRVVAPIVWFRHNTGPWLPSGDPATVTGGIVLAPLAGSPLFLTVQGTGDAGITLNAGASAFVGTAPLGYTAGLPHTGGGFTTLDPSKVFGSAGLSNGNLTAGFPTTPGMAQSVDGYTSGKLYCEIGNPTGDIFSADWGGGFGVDFTAGGQVSDWFDDGGFSGGNPNGGAIATGQTLINEFTGLGALTVQILANAFAFDLGSGDVIGIALYLSGSPVDLEATLADLFFAATPGFVDFTSVANRRQFINVNGGAQNLRADGSGPYAVTPPVFLSLEDSSAPNTFAQNKGRGGNFTITGPDLTAGATNPPGTQVTIQTPAATVPFTGVLGDYQTGKIYAFNPATLTDNGAQRKWVRRWRALPGDTTSAVSFAYLNVGLETGTEIPAGSLPQLVLRWSDDGGKTWSGNRIVPVGATGQTAFTVKFNRLGSTRRFGGSTRIFELSSTDPFKVSIMGAQVLTK